MPHVPRYTVNASILLTDLPLLQRPQAVADAGFAALELWWPFDTAVPSDREVEALVDAVQDAGVQLTGLNFFAGDMPAGERGLVSVPARASEFRDNVDVVVGIGERLGCRAFNALYGLRPDGADPERCDEVAVDNLALAARAAGRVGGTVLLEPVSGAPTYPLRTAGDALAVVSRTRREGVDNVRLLADLYHLSVNGDDVDAVVREHAADLGHVQVADDPGRGAPGTGDLPLERWLQEIYAGGYDGWVGLEYRADPAAEDPFAWLPRHRRPAAG